jgi:fructokinase
MAGAVGDDDLGRRALREFTRRGVDLSAVAVIPEPTGRVDVTVDSAGHASYLFAPDCAWDNLPWSEALAELARQASAVCFGTLGQRGSASSGTIRRFLSLVPSPALRILDINLRPPFWSPAVVRDSLPLANIVKCNDDELPALGRSLPIRVPLPAARTTAIGRRSTSGRKAADGTVGDGAIGKGPLRCSSGGRGVSW